MTNLTSASDQALREYLKREDVQHALQVSSIGYVYVQPFICLIGLALNIVNCCMFCRRAFASTPAYILMLALSVADGVTLGLRIPQGLV